MTLLLATDTVELYRPGDLDGHGWREPPEGRAVWCGPGNLQLNQGESDPRAADAGGRGPHDPASVPSGLLFLPVGACPREGWSAVVRGERYSLSQVRRIVDPSGVDTLDCWVGRATQEREP